MTSHVLPTTMMSSVELRPALVRADSDKSKERCADRPRLLVSHCPVVSLFSVRNELTRRDFRCERRLVDKRPKRQVSFNDTADCHHDGLVLQMRGEPSLYVAARDYLKRNSWIPMALCLLCVVVLAAMPSIINMI